MNETCTHCRLWNRPLSHHTKNNDVNISQTIYCLRVTFKYEMHYATDKMMHVSQTKSSQHKHAGIRWNFTKSTTSYRERSPRASNNFIQIMKIKQQQQHARLSTTSPSVLEAMISFYDGNRVLWHRNIKRKECSHYASQKASKIFTLAKKNIHCIQSWECEFICRQMLTDSFCFSLFHLCFRSLGLCCLIFTLPLYPSLSYAFRLFCTHTPRYCVSHNS